MEPAAGGRDDLNRSSLYAVKPEPQWSPPLVGGMTAPTSLKTLPSWVRPQWSPPLVGGMTRRDGEDAIRDREAAMEPAAGGRDD